MTGTSNKYRTALIYLVIAASAFAAFEQIRHCGFVYDDRECITDNENVKAGLTYNSVKWAFTSSHLGNWHPLTSISHIIDYELFGPNPLGHHITSLLFHIANALLLFAVLKKTTGETYKSAFVAAVFALHPLRVESVAWVSERKDILCGLFVLMTIAAYGRYCLRPNLKSYLAVFFLFSCALMSKPMAVTLPFVLLLLDFWPLGRVNLNRPPLPQSKNSKSSAVPVMKLLLEKIPLVLLAAAVSVITVIIQNKSGALFSLKSLPLSIRAANTFVSYVRYIGKILWPENLAVLYPHPLRTLPLSAAVICFLILAGISALVIYKIKSHRYLAVGWFWFLGTLVPVIGLVQVGSQAIADRYTYLPSIGINIMAAWGISRLSAKWQHKKIILAAAIVVLALLIIRTHTQVGYWKNRMTLYGHAVAVTKNNHMMHNNYGTALFELGRYNQAILEYEKAVQIEPKFFEARINIGKTILAQKRNEQAAEYFRGLIKLKPNRLEDSLLLAKILLVDVRDFHSAIEQYYHVLELKPDHIETMNNLAWLLATTRDANAKNPADSVGFAMKACELTDYEKPELIDTLAAAYAAEGRFAEAVTAAENALQSARSQNNQALAEQIKIRLALYKADKAYIEY